VTAISLHNPLFVTYLIAAIVSILNVVVSRLSLSTKSKADPERMRRVQREDLTLLCIFLVAGLVFVMRPPWFWIAQGMLLVYLVAQVAYLAVSMRAQTREEARLAFRMLGALFLALMAGWGLAAAADALYDLLD